MAAETQSRADLFSCGCDGRKVQPAIRQSRRADANEGQLSVHMLGDAAGDQQAASRVAIGDVRVNIGLANGRPTLRKQGDLFAVRVDRNDRVPLMQKARRDRRADLAEADHHDFHTSPRAGRGALKLANTRPMRLEANGRARAANICGRSRNSDRSHRGRRRPRA